jgi:hypothetical protein
MDVQVNVIEETDDVREAVPLPPSPCDPGAVALGVGSATGEERPTMDVPVTENGP